MTQGSIETQRSFVLQVALDFLIGDRALDVAWYAGEEHRRDMELRRKHYDALGMDPDDTVSKES